MVKLSLETKPVSRCGMEKWIMRLSHVVFIGRVAKGGLISLLIS